MEQRITLLTQGVKNLQRPKHFYKQVFGWLSSASSSESIVFFELKGIRSALFPQDSLADDAGMSPDGHGSRRFSLAHNVALEKEEEELVASLEPKGSTVLKRPDKVLWGGDSASVAPGRKPVGDRL
ncbi:hypothetical protein CLV24_109116 [Pontibacter ummariensis]|uniref:Glyoxalase-like domain-containing protein n=1 Tax=Pontibacter ummariensis TaxID=1610492 RepID=A0A239FNM4_9BACT|nr:hypothetical protein [Pontibacter ummariensis]PRY11991.1 hypothetical protein CLV24_109116 [Pontibacter ummariensis]SNS58457.1 hypothetical protein SAMN06296052_10954 [Pontibacter ummariensis]